MTVPAAARRVAAVALAAGLAGGCAGALSASAPRPGEAECLQRAGLWRAGIELCDTSMGAGGGGGGGAM
jgi:hypothetical protein